MCDAKMQLPLVIALQVRYLLGSTKQHSRQKYPIHAAPIYSIFAAQFGSESWLLQVKKMSSTEQAKEESDSPSLIPCSLEKVTTYFVVLTFVNFLNYVDRGVIPGSTNEFNTFIQVSKTYINT